MNPQKPISILEAVVATVIGLGCAGLLLLADVPLVLGLLFGVFLHVFFGEFPVDAYQVYPAVLYLWYLLGVSLALVVVDGGRASGPAGQHARAKGYWGNCWRYAGRMTKGGVITVLVLLGCCIVWPVYEGYRLAVYSRVGGKAVYTRDGSVEPAAERSIDINFSNVTIDDRQLLSLGTDLRSIDSLRLNLSGTAITDDGLEAIASTPNLLALNLYNTAVTDEGVAKLTGCTSLLALNLSRTRTTDTALETVSRFPKLRDLRLADTLVSDEGVQRLHEMPSLRLVQLWTPRVSDQAMANLQTALPGVEVQRSSFVNDEQPEKIEARAKPKRIVFFLFSSLVVAALGLGPFYLAYRDSNR